MGYFTRFTWDMEPETPAARDYVREHEEDLYGIEPDGSSPETVKWYEHEGDMLAMSLHFPDVLFVLHGEGDGACDVWNKYFKNGKMQVARANINFDEFDEAKLR